MAIDFGPIQSIGNIFANSLKYFQNRTSGTASGKSMGSDSIDFALAGSYSVRLTR